MQTITRQWTIGSADMGCDVMETYFIVSDIHSYYKELMGALKEKQFNIDNPHHHLICCGDLFDRGPGTRELFKFVIGLGDRFHYVRGNHEDLLFDALINIEAQRDISNHHVSNGTIQTIADFCEMLPRFIIDPARPTSINDEVYIKTAPLRDFIQNKSMNYLTLGDFVFVHGWIPCVDEGESLWYNKPVSVIPMTEWDSDRSSYWWRKARWLNGMRAWQDGFRLSGKTIVCGHWHCSWGWSHIKNERKEFPGKSREDWLKSFEPFTEDGIIAIDACTAYSGIVNCIKMEVEE